MRGFPGFHLPPPSLSMSVSPQRAIARTVPATGSSVTGSQRSMAATTTTLGWRRCTRSSSRSPMRAKVVNAFEVLPYGRRVTNLRM